MRLKVRQGCQNTLFEPSAPNWFELEGDSRATLVKSGHHRQTWRVNLGEEVVFAKLFDFACGGAFKRFVFSLGLSPAHREWRALLAAERRGVPAIRGLGIGVDLQYRIVLLSAGLSKAVPLSQAWESASSNRASALSLIDAVARLFASAHNRGFVHRDGHPSNILVEPSSDSGWLARFADVHGAKLFRDTASARDMIRSLAQLDHYFHRRATRSQRLRFLRTYLPLRQSVNRRGNRRAFFREMLTALGQARKTHAAALARQRDRRIHRNGKYFTTMTLGNGSKGTFVLQLERRHAFPESGVPDRTEREWRDILQPMAGGSAGVLTTAGLHADCSKPDGLWTQLLWSIVGTSQRREFIRSHRLRHRDVRSELILGYLEHRGPGGLIDETILLRPKCDPALGHGRVLRGEAIVE